MSASIMFLPQRLYLPVGALKDAVAFPEKAENFGLERIRELLVRCNLRKLVDRLDEEAPWQDLLSPGEQQRLAMVRVVLRRPDYLVVDEATSALDAANTVNFYEVLLKELPQLTLLAVVHSPPPQGVYNRRAVIADGKLTLGEDPA